MSKYYRGKRSRNLFNPTSKKPYKLSRSKIALFIECPRCFYIDRRLGIGRPPGYPFNLNTAVDGLLKKEFDMHRMNKTAHPLMKAYGIDAVPFQHTMMKKWRNSLSHGIKYHHKSTNLIITGGIDDLWINSNKELHIVDYKATAKAGDVNLDADWQISYKRQAEIYQWLFRMNGFKVSDISYFVYCNGRMDREAFDGRLEFKIKVIPYKGDDGWVEKAVKDAHKCLISDKAPEGDPGCDYCRYCELVKKSVQIGLDPAERV